MRSLRWVLILSILTTLVIPGARPLHAAPDVEARVLVASGGRVAWSHRANLIAFDHLRSGGAFEISVIRPDGTDLRCLTCGRSGLPRSHRGNPAWHPSGEFIVFQAHDPALSTGRQAEGYLGTPGIGINNDIWVMSADGSRAWRLTRVQSREGVLHPHFSHDGRKLLWSEIIDPRARGMGGQWAVRLADFVVESGVPAVRNVQTLRPGDLQLYETHGFSPDDRRILFTASPRGGDYYDMEIYTLELATGRLLGLTRNREWDEHAQFTADGRRIVWASSTGIQQRRDPRDLRLDYWVMSDEGADPQRLTHFNGDGRSAIAADFEFGPDGKTIVAKMGAAGRGETIVLIRLFN